MKSDIEITAVGPPEAMSERERRWSEAAGELEFGALARVRDLGEKWAASLTGALGVVGLAALIDGNETFKTLADSPKQVAQAAFVLAVLATLVATSLAISVSQSTGKRLTVESGSELRRRSEEAVDQGLRFIRWSQILALVAVTGVLVAGGLLWFGKHEASGGPTVIDIPVASALCGGMSTIPEVSPDSSIVVRCVR